MRVGLDLGLKYGSSPEYYPACQTGAAGPKQFSSQPCRPPRSHLIFRMKIQRKRRKRKMLSIS